MPLDLRTPHELATALGDRLRARRLQINLSQADLASKAGVTRGSIVSIEAGCGTTLDTFLRVIHALDVTHIIEAIAPEVHASPIEQFNGMKPRQRASRSNSSSI